jgi:Ca2+-transporting ATPase
MSGLIANRNRGTNDPFHEHSTLNTGHHRDRVHCRRPDPGVMQRPSRKPGTKIVTRPWIIRWFIFAFTAAATALCVLEWGPGKPSTTHASVNMTVAFAIVSLSAVNIGLIMRCERQAPWSSPLFPCPGWILTRVVVELNMLQRLLFRPGLSPASCGTNGPNTF